MNFRITRPPSHLADYIRLFWYMEYSANAEQRFVHHSFAHHCAEIVFCYKGEFRFKPANDREQKLFSGIYGQTPSTSTVLSDTDFGVFGFYLYPHALTQLFGIPASEITNQSVDIKTLCGAEGERLEENIMLAADNEQRMQFVARFLESRLQKARTEFSNLCSSIKAISTAFASSVSVNALAADHFLSVRQFERRFKEFAGFSPKQFLRIARFNALLNKPFHNMSFAEIAFEYGYYDQAHFSHDFKQFSGFNPKDYFKPETLLATDRGTITVT